MEFPKPQAEHRKLDALEGSWTFEHDVPPAPDQPPQKVAGRVTTRSLGGMWLQLEMVMPWRDGGEMTSLMTLGYDPAMSRYVGSFISSCMPNLWVYSGSFDADGKRLVLDTEGPKFDKPGTTKYQDMIEIVDADHWILSSQQLSDDGNWVPFMTAHHYRIK